VADAQSKIRLLVEAVGQNDLRKTRKEIDKLKDAAGGAQNNIRRTSGALRDTGKAAKVAETGVNRLNGAIRNLLGAFTAIQAAKFVIFKTAELQKQTRSLEVLTGSLETAKDVIADLQAFGRVTPFTSSELIETAKRLKAFGFETEKIVDVTKRLADVAGATGADLGGIATAFGQIQAKGRLQGEELLQLQERGVDLQGTLREAYGLTAEEFQKALSAGRIGADAVNFALEKLTETGGKYAGGAIAQSDTLSGKFSTLVDNIEAIARAIGEKLTPALSGALDVAIQTASVISTLLTGGQALDFGKARVELITPGGTEKDLQRILDLTRQASTAGLDEAGLKALAGQIKTNQQVVQDVLANINLRRPFGATGKEIDLAEAIQGASQRLIAQLGARQVELQQGARPLTPVKPPPLTEGKGKTPRAGKKSPLEQQQEQAARLLQTEKDRQFVLQQSNEKQRLGAQLINDIAGIKRDNSLLDDKTLADLIQAKVGTYQLQVQEIERAAASKAEDDRKRKALQEQQKEAQRLDAIYGQLGQTIATGVTDMIMAAVDSTKSLAEVASNMLNNLANQLLQVAINSALFGLFPNSSLFKALPRFADGGSISGGQPAIVGERGPELFMPGRSGSIVPNDSLGGATINVTVDASGTNVESDAEDRRRLGEAIGVAIRQELIKQKRPGGLLA